MPRSLLSTRPRATHGVHRFRNMRLLYCGEYLSGFHVLLNLRALGLKDREILPILEYLERQQARRALLAMQSSTHLLQ